ncbi:hypothetical protein [Luteibacter yeojuensis]|uniref:Uncharacterized protein n=1 Tax=Luteibacter yeojuensis TaxID=345309 RepID=A0A0F3KPG8_9GAMM|nr:hypothetical protein [Luteibacter yeojuensis]KJV33155.1 hypothetical protein VI08_11460 [Luteibacter yeojuensis]
MFKDVRKAWRWPVFVASLLISMGSIATLLAARLPVHAAASRSPVGRYLQPGDSYAMAFARLANHVDTDPTALYALWQASLPCAGGMARDLLQRRGYSASEKAFRYWQAAYCNDMPQDGWAFWYGQGVSTQFRLRHPNWPHARHAKVPTGFYADVLRDAPAADIRTAWMAILEPGQVPWRFGEDLVANTPYHERLAKLQGIALMLLECDLVGGCGPDGPITFGVCRWQHDCQWGASLGEIFHARYTSGEMRIAEALHERLVAERAQWASAHPARALPPLRAVRHVHGERAEYAHWLAHWHAARIGRISRRR